MDAKLTTSHALYNELTPSGPYRNTFEDCVFWREIMGKEISCLVWSNMDA